MRKQCRCAGAVLLTLALMAVVFSCSENDPQVPQDFGQYNTLDPFPIASVDPAVGVQTIGLERTVGDGAEFASTNGAIEQVDPSELTCAGVITFEDVAGGAAPGTNYDAVFESEGAEFAERFLGQTRSTLLSGGYEFDALSGVPTGPLSLQVGEPNQNLCVYDSPACGNTQVLAGVGPVGYPDFNGIAEGSFAVLFDFDQSEFGFRICAGDGGSLTIDFFKRDGALIDQITLTGLSDQVYAFRRVGGIYDVAGVSVQNTDPAGIVIDDICHDVPGVPGRPVRMDIKPRSCPNPFNVKLIDDPENAKSMKGGVLPVALLGTEDFDVMTIDPASVYLEGVAPVRYAYEDVTTPVEGVEECECTTLGPDGYMDLTLKFTVREISAALGPVMAGDIVELTITGTLLDGTVFEATDCVTIIGDMTLPKR